MRRRGRRLACALVVLAAAAASAEDPEDLTEAPWRGSVLPEQWRAVPDSPVMRVPSPITRDETVQQVSLKETIAIALENNPGIRARRLEPLRQSEAVLQAQSQYDPTFSGELLSNQSTTPSGNVLAGSSTLNVDDRTANFHLFKTFRTSTRVSFDFLNERFDRNSTFDQLKPQYIPNLNASIVQPLLRDFGWDFSYLVVRVAEEQADAAVYQYEALLADFVEQVIESYWNVIRTRETVEVQRESKALADRTVAENEARVRVGLLPPVAVLEARADAASREADVIVGENALAVARQRLAQLAFYRPDATVLPRTLEPVEEQEPEKLSVEFDKGPALVDDSLATALAERPEIEASARGVKVTLLNERIASNSLLPRLDLVGSYGTNGLSGTGRQTFNTVQQIVNVPAAIPGENCVPQPAPATGFYCIIQSAAVVPPSPFAGPRSDAYERLTSNDFRSYSFGVQFEMPLSNAAARSQYAQTRISRSQAELNHRELQSQVTLEVRQAVADLIATRKRIDATKVARELAAENLRNQEKRHEVGMATTKDLLDFQTRLTTARAAEVQARADYAVAIARWRRAEGRLLDEYQVVLDQPGKRSKPWFARF